MVKETMKLWDFVTLLVFCCDQRDLCQFSLTDTTLNSLTLLLNLKSLLTLNYLNFYELMVTLPTRYCDRFFLLYYSKLLLTLYCNTLPRTFPTACVVSGIFCFLGFFNLMYVCASDRFLAWFTLLLLFNILNTLLH